MVRLSAAVAGLFLAGSIAQAQVTTDTTPIGASVPVTTETETDDGGFDDWGLLGLLGLAGLLGRKRPDTVHVDHTASSRPRTP